MKSLKISFNLREKEVDFLLFFESVFPYEKVLG